MAGYLTDYANNLILDQYFGAVSNNPAPTLYIGLSLQPANKAGTVTEPSGGAYARAAVSNDLAHFPRAVSGTKSNALSIVFPNPSLNWGTIVSIFVADSSTGGNIMAMADLPAAKPILAGGGSPTIATSALYISHT
jgi:hypothetical protein